MLQEKNSIVVIDKPAGVSSAQVVSRIKRVLGARKVGHTGTLDPLATGILICCINQATRLARFFLTGPKRYEGVMYTGVETDTQDATGSVIRRTEITDLSIPVVESVFKQFIGLIEQKPPIYSAIKHKGIPLYKLARKGKPVQKPSRVVYIYDIGIKEIILPQIRFEVFCSSGTYIRTLCADIGTTLGCGAHLVKLRRIENCGFNLSDALTLEEFEKACRLGTIGSRIFNMADALKNMPERQVNGQIKDKIRKGIPLTPKDITRDPQTGPNGFLKIVDDHHELIAVLSQQRDGKPYRYCCVFL